jgi:predicted nucleic acid-binding protein/antitoxin component of MazEF toxin-antitoxin module
MSNYVTTVIKTGNSYALRVPKKYIEDAQLELGQKATIQLPIPQPKQNRERIQALLRRPHGREKYEKTELYQAGNSLMILLDTNILIYLANGTLNRNIIINTDIAHASVTRIEALGFSAIPANELLLLSALLDESYTLDLTGPVIEQAIKLRQIKRMSLGDAIIAATALAHGLTLWTANTEDFNHVENLTLYNPLA